MAFGGSAPNKTYTRTDGVRSGAAVCAQAKAALVNDTAALADARENDIATALNLCWTRDGGTQPSADLPMNSKKFTGLADGTAATDSVTLGQVQTGNLIYAEAGGTANAITLTSTISFAAAEGVSVEFIAEADNSGATTIALNGGSALAVQYCGAALIGGEIRNLQAHRVTHDGTQWQLQNSARLKDIGSLAKTDSNIIVGDGTNWVAETGATARTSLGLGTGDSPQFTAVNFGSTDTTVDRLSAGDIQVEGNRIFRVGGTDVPIADGGTGASTAANAFANLKQNASTSATGVVQLADQTAMEALTSGRVVTADVQHLHPGAPKFWAYITWSGGTPTLIASYNVSGITDSGTGHVTITFATPFSSANWACSATAEFSSNSAFIAFVNSATRAAGSIAIFINTSGNNPFDPVAVNVMGFGDQ